jgi:hypothetical protein
VLPPSSSAGALRGAVLNGQFEDGLTARAIVLQNAGADLAAEVEQLRAKLFLSRSTAEIVSDIKQITETRVGSQGLTVLQVLCDREYAKNFNADAAAMFPDVLEAFHDGIDDFARSKGGQEPPRKTRKFADNLWKQNPDADRRVREGSTEPYRGRPQIYDPDVLLAIADHVARTAGRSNFTTGHHGDTTLSDDKGSPLLRVLAATVRWVMVIAWQTCARPGTPPPPIVKLEGIRSAINRTRTSTD